MRRINLSGTTVTFGVVRTANGLDQMRESVIPKSALLVLDNLRGVALPFSGGNGAAVSNYNRGLVVRELLGDAGRPEIRREVAVSNSATPASSPDSADA
jgi:hypothetical protein